MVAGCLFLAVFRQQTSRDGPSQPKTTTPGGPAEEHRPMMCRIRWTAHSSSFNSGPDGCLSQTGNKTVVYKKRRNKSLIVVPMSKNRLGCCIRRRSFCFRYSFGMKAVPIEWSWGAYHRDASEERKGKEMILMAPTVPS